MCLFLAWTFHKKLWLRCKYWMLNTCIWLCIGKIMNINKLILYFDIARTWAEAEDEGATSECCGDGWSWCRWRGSLPRILVRAAENSFWSKQGFLSPHQRQSTLSKPKCSFTCRWFSKTLLFHWTNFREGKLDSVIVFHFVMLTKKEIC